MDIRLAVRAHPNLDHHVDRWPPRSPELGFDLSHPARRPHLGVFACPRAADLCIQSCCARSCLGHCDRCLQRGAGILLPFALAPRTATPLDLLFSLQTYRSFVAYWVAVFAAGAFVLSCVLVVQGCLAHLPRRLSLRFSSVLQLAAFCLFLSGYFLEPSLASQAAFTENPHLLVRLPSYWFFAIFQQLNRSLPAPEDVLFTQLAARGWLASVSVGLTAALLFVLSYLRTIRKLVEEPDIIPSQTGLNWIPYFGNGLHTPITQFSVRALARSKQHRAILAFYLGIGFAIAVLFLKTPLAQRPTGTEAGLFWHHASPPLLASSFVMMFAWLLAVRIAFAIPLDLRANWVFRVTQVRPASDYVAAGRRAAYLIALTPVCSLSFITFTFLWTWRQSLTHLFVLALIGMIFLELWLHRFRKIPCTCSYLPGKSNIHVTFLLCLTMGLNLLLWGASLERRALSDFRRYLWMLAALAILAALTWLRRVRSNREQPDLQFEDEIPPELTALNIQGW
jgi:hypothetical protein